MNPNHQNNQHPDEEVASSEVIEMLRGLPSETATPRPDIDKSILDLANQKMASIRNQKIIRRNWSFGAIAACLLLGGLCFMLFKSNFTNGPDDQTASKDDVLIYKEVEALFNDSLGSVIINESGLQIVLSESPDTKQRQPVVIKVCNSDKCQKVITFVGQTVEVAGYTIAVKGQTKDQITIESAPANSNEKTPSISIKSLSA